MKMTDNRPTDGAFRARRMVGPSAASGLPALAASVGGGHASATLTNALGIPEDELTPTVREGLDRLMAEIDRLRRELDTKDRRISHLERLADEDPLAPILNRRAFVRELSRMMAFAERYGGSSSIIYFDVDNMKTINDTYGHSAGDAALTHVAGVLTRNLRRSDAVGRLGGDEFGVLLAQTDGAVAAAKAANLKAAVEMASFVWDGRDLSVSVSYGACAFDGRGAPHEILRAADQAMYRQKRGPAG